MAVKPPSIASLVRAAAISEAALINVLTEVLRNENADRIYDVWSRITVPKLFVGEDAAENPAETGNLETPITDWDGEIELSKSFNLFVDRHIRKLKWHASHPDITGVVPCMHIYSVLTIILEIRIKRISMLLDSQEIMNADEWGTARELLNRTYRDFREGTKILVNRWLNTVMEICDRDEIREGTDGLPDVIRGRADRLATLRETLENRRHQMAVQPEGYPLVRPPRYFGGDLLSEASWKLWWGDVGDLADSAEQTILG